MVSNSNICRYRNDKGVPQKKTANLAILIQYRQANLVGTVTTIYENQPLHTTATSLNVKQRLILMAALAGHSCHWPLAEKLDSHLPLLVSRTWHGEFIWTLKIHLPFGTLPCRKGVDSILHHSLNMVPFVSNLLEGMHVNVIQCFCIMFTVYRLT